MNKKNEEEKKDENPNASRCVFCQNIIGDKYEWTDKRTGQKFIRGLQGFSYAKGRYICELCKILEEKRKEMGVKNMPEEPKKEETQAPETLEEEKKSEDSNPPAPAPEPKPA